MFHQQGSASHRCFQRSYLFVQQDSFPLAGLIGCQRIIHFTAGIEQRLLEAEGSFFLLCTGQCGTGLPLVLC